MMAGRLFDKSVTVRELMPQDLKIDIHQLSREQATTIAGYLAGVVGRAHARQMDQATRRSWKAELARNRCAVMALAERGRADGVARGRLSRSLPPLRLGRSLNVLLSATAVKTPR
jgi:hypothetical protein